MASFEAVILNMGPDKTCEFCGKPIAFPASRQANMEANGITLTSFPPLSMHANCLREALLYLGGLRRNSQLMGVPPSESGNVKLAGEKTVSPSDAGGTSAASGARPR